MKKIPLLTKIFCLFLLSGIVFFMVDQNAFLYSNPVAKIQKIEQIELKETTDIYQNQDKEISQQLTLKLLNGTKEVIQMRHETNQSETTDLIYRQGQKVILGLSSKGYRLIELKRDALIVSMLVLFIGLLFIFISFKSSLFLILSLLLNFFYFISAIFINVKWQSSFFLIFILLALIFIFSSSLFILGWNWQSFYSCFTSLVTLILTALIVFLVLLFTKNSGIHFEYLNFATQNPKEIFFMTCIIAVLGSIMDETSDIVIGLFALFRQNQIQKTNKKVQDYFQSGMLIGRASIAAQTNILFMVFMAEVIPHSILLLANGNTLSQVLAIEMNLGLLQTMISAIGIVLAVPITAFLTSYGCVKIQKEITNE
ncbi:MAG: YibE/F family protein [Lactovum sp.]